MKLTKKQKELIKSLSTNEQFTVAMYVVEKVAGTIVRAGDLGKLEDTRGADGVFMALQYSFSFIKDLRDELESIAK